MIPSEEQAKALWKKYNFPEQKRIHVRLVARVAMALARQCQMLNAKCQINEKLLLAAALLHDIDKNIPRLPEEKHPDTAVKILIEEGMQEVADIVKTHPLHAILDPAISPKTLEEKILYLSDKMVKYDIVGVDGRFALWRAEKLPEEVEAQLAAAYPKVKALENEMFSFANLTLEDIIDLA